MSEPWVLYFLVFAAVFLAVQGATALVGGDLARRRVQDRRFAAATGGVERDEKAIEIVKRRAGESWGRLGGPIARLDRLIMQSGLGMKRARLGLVLAVLWAVAALLLPASLGAAPRALGGLVLAAALAGAVLAIRRRRRIARFGEQLPDVLDVIVRSLRAGHPPSVSLSLVAREMPEPAGPEFAVVFDEVSYGRDLREALDNLSDRVGHDDLRFLVISVSVASRTGGDLGEILASLSRLIRDRFRLRRKVRALSSEGRFSAVALSIIPVALFGIINLLSKDFYREVWGHPVLDFALGAAAALMIVGNVVMYRMVNFKV
jgi:tight adherence protein B